MIISKAALVFLTFIIIFSVFVANVANLINVDLIREKSSANGRNEKTHKEKERTMSDSMEHLIWFLQISDIHISIFQDKSRITELREFCDVTLSVIQPKVVIASGDLTDAKTSDHIGSRQYEEEWKYYNQVLHECRVNEKTKWLDIRGNHDNFNVASLASKENYYLNYSMQGKYHNRSYMHQVKTKDDVYSFIAIDACLDPGPRRPFNFVGILKENEINKIRILAEEARLSGSKHIVWFGHFPTSCILTATPGGVRPIIGHYPESLVYVCGHLHQLGGIVKNMYTLQKAGFLELEIGDWKDNRMYRLMAIDHGLFSFTDIKHQDWPVVLITNPKSVLYTIPHREPTKFISQSSHIRILAFSVSKITNVSVKIDDYEWKDCYNVQGPFYIAEWNPDLFKVGLHDIQVHVKDMHGREKIVSHSFALDDTKLSFDFLAKLLLMTNASTVFQLLFGIGLIICILPLCLLRYAHKLVKENKIRKPVIKNSCFRCITRKMWTLVTIDRLFYPLVLYPVYISIGPWAVGYIIEQHFGVIFSWGIFVKGAFLPGSFTYLYGFLQLFIFQVPFTFVLANCADYRINSTIDNSKKLHKWYRIILFNTPFFIIFGVQTFFAYLFWLSYGTTAFLLGPLRTWTIIYGIILWWHALHLPEKCFREALFVWGTKSKVETDEEPNTDNM